MPNSCRKAVLKWLPVGLASFGGDNSKTNERYRHWGLKADTNEAMRETYYQQVKAFITKEWGVPLPETARGFIEQRLGGNLSAHAIYVAG